MFPEAFLTYLLVNAQFPGLPCGSFPEGYHPETAKAIQPGKDQVWKRLFWQEACRMLETEQNMSEWRKVRIALIIIVEGVLIAM